MALQAFSHFKEVSSVVLHDPIYIDTMASKRHLIATSLVGVFSGWLSAYLALGHIWHNAQQPQPYNPTPSGFTRAHASPTYRSTSTHASQRSSETNPDEVPFPESGVTSEDVERDSAMAELAAKGHYFLPSDKPIYQKRLKWSLERIATNHVNEMRSHYEATFRSMGLTPEQSEQAMRHIAKVREASLGLSNKMIEFEESRAILVQRLQTQLSAENYTRFQAEEHLNRGRLNLSALATEWERVLGARPTDEQSRAVLELTSKTGAYVHEPRDGIYDSYPEVGWGNEACAALTQRKIDRLSRSLPSLESELTASQFSPQERNLIVAFYHSALEQNRKEVAKLQQPPVEHLDH